MATDFTIRPVESARERKRFIDFPYQFYKESTYWIPPLRMDQATVLSRKKNPFFQHGRIQEFIAEDGYGKMIGRIAGIVNGMHLKKYGDGNGFFGFFECVERYDVAEALFNAARAWLKTQNLTGMRGPCNPSMNDVAGLLVDGFDRYPSLMMPYNPAYYQDYLLQYGFTRAMTMWAYYIQEKYRNMDRMYRGVEVIRRRNPDLKVRTLDMSRFDEEARTILDIYNDAWSDNWGHVPMTDAEFAHLAKDLKQIVDPRIVFILEKAGRPIGFSISLPNMNQALRHVRDGRLFPFGLFQLLLRSKFGGVYEIRTLLMGIVKEYQGKGYDAVMNLASLTSNKGTEYTGSEMSWVLDANKPMVNAMEALGGVRDKEYAMFQYSF